MNFDLYENIKQLIEIDELDKAILFSENELKKLPETDFHKLIDWDITVIAETVCERINLFYDYASKDLEKVDALYCEMNGFTINYDQWYVDFFAYSKFQGHENYDWLADWDYENYKLSVTFIGIEDILGVFRDYIENEKWNDDLQEKSFEIAEIIVILRLQQLFRQANIIAKSKNYLWTKIPFLATAHDYDLLYKVTGL
jgi:hypothetical protein